MAWTGTFTFNGDDGTQLERVRNLLSDVDSSDVLAYDEQYAPFLTGGDQDQANDYLAAAMVAGIIANKFARGVQSVSAGGTSVVFDISSGRAKFFRDLAVSLRVQAARSGSVAPYCGGISIPGKRAIESDPDRVQPSFTRSMGDMPESSTTTSQDWP